MNEYKPLEIAKILGEPRDPKKPYPQLVNLLCETDTAAPDEYVYYFDVLVETDYVYTITSTGEVTQQNVTPDTPTLFTFADYATPEYYVKITDLASAKERTLARKVATINRSLDAIESYKIVTVTDAAVPVGNQFSLSSGYTRFTYADLVNMIDSVTDYADNYVLLVGTTIDKDIKLWDWNDNKYTSLAMALDDLNVNIIRQFGTVTVDGSPVSILSATKAYLFGLNGVSGKPLLFVRKQLNDIDLLGGALYENGTKPERLIFVSPNPVTANAGANRYLAVGIIGYEQFVLAVTNPYAIARFNRA